MVGLDFGWNGLVFEPKKDGSGLQLKTWQEGNYACMKWNECLCCLPPRNKKLSLASFGLKSTVELFRYVVGSGISNVNDESGGDVI